MQKWEYSYFQTEYHLDSLYYTGASRGRVGFKKEDQAQTADVYKYLDTLGAEAWEMLAVDHDRKLHVTRYHFKRPLE